MHSFPLRPIAYVLAASAHGTMIVNRNDYHQTASGTVGVGHQILSQSCFDPEELQLLPTLLAQLRATRGDGVVALDCGANIGVHTLEMARGMHGWGQVIAIEAQERIFYALAGNIAINNCFNARAIWGAVGAESGTIQVPAVNYTAPGSYGSLELRESMRNEFIGQFIQRDVKTQPTPLFTLDSLQLERVDFIKIDIEGMEIEALTGAQATIARCKPHMLIERIKTNESELSSYITALGYTVFPVGMNLLAIHASDADMLARIQMT